MISTAATWAARAASSVFPEAIGRLPTSARTIYLTIDDGPSHFSLELLDALQEANVPATFFLRGDRIERHRAAAESIASAEHGIGNHSFHHLDGWTNRWSSVRDDLERGEESIASLTGTAPLWVRPPFGRFRRSTLKWCRDHGRRLALWDVIAGDFVAALDSSLVVDDVATHVRPGSLLVVHDGDEQQPKALSTCRLLLDRLAEDEWTFELLPNSAVDESD